MNLPFYWIWPTEQISKIRQGYLEGFAVRGLMLTWQTWSVVPFTGKMITVWCVPTIYGQELAKDFGGIDRILQNIRILLENFGRRMGDNVPKSLLRESLLLENRRIILQKWRKRQSWNFSMTYSLCGSTIPWKGIGRGFWRNQMGSGFLEFLVNLQLSTNLVSLYNYCLSWASHTILLSMMNYQGLFVGLKSQLFPYP